MSSCWSCGPTCEPAERCPPWVAQAGLNQPSAYEGFSFCITKEELLCDFGAEVAELANEVCSEDPDDQCTRLDNVLNQACAYVWSRLGLCYELPLQSVRGGAVFETAPAAVINYSPGSLQFNVYWLVRHWMGVYARYLLWKDFRRVPDGENQPEAIVRAKEVMKLLGAQGSGCDACNCSALPGVLLKQVESPSDSGLAVAYRPPSTLPRGNCALPLRSQGGCGACDDPHDGRFTW